MTTLTSSVRSWIAPTGEQWDLFGTIAAIKRDDDGPMYLSLDGIASNCARTPDQTPFNLAGKDFEVTICLALADYTPAAQQRMIGQYGTVGQQSWLFYLNVTNGNMLFLVSNDGTAITKNYAVTPPGGWVDGDIVVMRARFRYNDGGVSTCEFFAGAPGTTLALVGAKQTHTGLISIWNSTLNLGVGGDSTGGAPCNGKVFWAEVRDGIDGPVIALFNPNQEKLTQLGLGNLNSPREIPATLAPATEASINPAMIVAGSWINYNPLIAPMDLTGFYWTPSTATKKKSPRILRNSFGDGYEQRIADGINFNPREWALSWVRVKEEIEAIEAFLEAAGGVHAFTWTDPEGYEGRWVCEEWTRSPIGQADHGHDISAVFKQKFGV